ncbi:MAG: hypothetical protein AB7I50_21685 [Vicinamibacterales bacterium]
MGFLEWIQNSSFATALSTSDSIWGYAFILTLHTAGLAVVMGASIVFDLRVLGVGQQFPLASLRRMTGILWWGFTINAVTGVLLFTTNAVTFGLQKTFYLKLAFILGAMIVGARNRATVFGSSSVMSGNLSGDARALAALSLALWVGATFAGRYMAYV